MYIYVSKYIVARLSFPSDSALYPEIGIEERIPLVVASSGLVRVCELRVVKWRRLKSGRWQGQEIVVSRVRKNSKP